uniref:Uncharacterized protein n=1 Tax=Arion vulgaris TaxID=1028688 RepID=A0A0B7AYY5_9EUPU
MSCCGAHPGNSAVQPVKVGSKHDSKFEGPIRDRQCRDVVFLVLFLGFLCGLKIILLQRRPY